MGTVSCHDHTSMMMSVARICAPARIQAIPPHSVNCASESTSAVTRATKIPRFSFVCSAIDSSWMCANVRTRRFASACSDTVVSRLPDSRPAT